MKEKKKPKQASSAKSASSAPEPDEILAGRLVNLALELRELDAYAVLPDALQKAQAELHRAIRKCLQQKRDAALDEALERAFEEDGQAYRVLRSQVEEMSGTILLHRDNGADIEVNAFVVPFFVHTKGGLRIEQSFQDVEAFEQLRDSFKEGGLESRKANVVLVAHAYHLDELDRIGYHHLHAMVQEAHDAMARKKAVAADAIASSMSGWPPSHFEPDDQAMELRFLLGFASKTLDDPFYKVPEKEEAADRYFEARAERFRKWSQQIAPLVQRCLVTDGREVRIDFLYQDLFHGGKEAAQRELDMLQLLSEVQQSLDMHNTAAEEAQAIIGPLESEDDEVLRISLQNVAADAPISAIDKLLGRNDTMESAVADVADGLASIGLRDIQIARGFDSEERPIGARPYSPR